MGKLIAPTGVILGAAVWLLLFVILGTGLGISFIVAGSVVGAGLIATALLATGPIGDAPLTATGLLLGIAAFVIMAVVLSVPLWIDVVAGLGTAALYAVAAAAIGESPEAPDASNASPATRFMPRASTRSHNGHQAARRESVATH